MIHAYASRRHYAAHLLPIWEKLPPELRGRFMAQRGNDPWGAQTRHPDLPTSGPILVASYQDAVLCRGHDLIHVEHGAGQTYIGDHLGAGHPSYAGGRAHELEAVRLFLVPGLSGVERWAAAYPAARVEAVGCPKLDRWVARPNPSPRVIGITFHWECTMVPESRSAFQHHRRHLPRVLEQLRADGFELVGHAHPKQEAYGLVLADAWGVPVVWDEAELFARAGTLIADNTSLLFEFAALGRPVVCLNAPWYRRHVEHGLRFWSHVPGPQVDDTSDLLDTVRRVVAGGSAGMGARAAGAAYARVGDAAATAASMVLEVH